MTIATNDYRAKAHEMTLSELRQEMDRLHGLGMQAEAAEIMSREDREQINDVREAQNLISKILYTKRNAYRATLLRQALNFIPETDPLYKGILTELEAQL